MYAIKINSVGITTSWIPLRAPKTTAWIPSNNWKTPAIIRSFDAILSTSLTSEILLELPGSK